MSLSHPKEGWELTRITFPNWAAKSPARVRNAFNRALMGIHRLVLFPRDIFGFNSAEEPLTKAGMELGAELSNGVSNDRFVLRG